MGVEEERQKGSGGGVRLGGRILAPSSLVGQSHGHTWVPRHQPSHRAELEPPCAMAALRLQLEWKTLRQGLRRVCVRALRGWRASTASGAGSALPAHSLDHHGV